MTAWKLWVNSLALLLLAAGARGQSAPRPPVPDSLRSVLAAAPPGSAARAAALLRVGRAYLQPFDSAGVVSYSVAAEQAAYQAKEPVLAGLALDLRGDFYREAGQPALARPLLERAGPLLATATAAEQAAQRYHLGMALGDLRQPGPALVLYREAARLGAADRQLQANVLNSTGLIYYRQNRHDSAVANFFRALRLTPGLRSTGPESATLGNLGLVYVKQRRWAEAAQYFRRGKALEAAAGDTMSLASSWQYLAQVQMARDSLRAALTSLRISERLSQRSHLAHYLPEAWRLLGQVHQRLRQPDSARYYLLRAVAAQRHHGAANYLAGSLVTLAEFYVQQQQWAAADEAAQQATTAASTSLSVQARAWGVRRQLALQRHDYPAAYAALARQQTLRDSLRTLDNQQLTELLRTSFETDQAEAAVLRLQREREVLQLRRQQLTLAIVLGAVVVLAGAGLLIGAYRRRQLRRELALRNRLSADLHDEVGGLLTQISMQANLLSAGLYAPAEQQTQLQEVAATSRAAAAQLQDVVWGYDAHNDAGHSLPDRMRDYAHELLGEGELSVTLTADPALAARTLPMEMRRTLYLIYKEALHNIAKHARAARHVAVALAFDGPALQLTVADDGPAPAQPPRASGHGLRNMQSRAEAVGGSFAAGYGAVPGQPGWGVRVRVPAPAAG
ncbi:histidine kinase [Hymenobacter sp. ASUV-10]|uniref:histidine kinase n=1 Tax=Hymenobacter aranciens TaxID=3063996 RepID=A0ABT9B4K3_9BACT|nr:histidine kinase [Hymenobacter sp. ASUV-10]MDO7873169.1 histidine kinase [Hymenobacter sp. ASUV-10]